MGSTFVDILRLFQKDPNTDLVVLIGEIGGSDEEEAAAYIGSLPSGERKPVVTFISGRSAPPGKRMGHAGAIISGGSGTAAEKMQAFEENGIKVAKRPIEIAQLIAQALKK